MKEFSKQLFLTGDDNTGDDNTGDDNGDKEAHLWIV